LHSNPGTIGAITGSTLLALLLTGSPRTPGSSSNPKEIIASPSVALLNAEGRKLFAAAGFQEARDSFRAAASLAHSLGDERSAAMNWNNAGACSLATMQFRLALSDLSLARRTAESAREMRPLIFTLNNLASLYIQMGQPEEALRISRNALAGPAGNADDTMRGKLFCQRGKALSDLNQFSEAGPAYHECITRLIAQNDLGGAALAWGVFGNDSLRAERLDDAEKALNESLRIARTAHLNASANVLCGLATIRGRRGDRTGAVRLFEAAMAAPPGLTPRWTIYASRARFRLREGDVRGALADFRESRRIAMRMRADAVPADQDRIALESGLSVVLQGLVDAGNRVARQTGDRGVLAETFDAAEQDRVWSLRALVPSPDDWRTRLPERYWNVLAQYQSLERAAVARSSPEIEAKASALRMELQQIEAAAAGGSLEAAGTAESPLVHVQEALDDDSILLSFHITETSSWLWAVDRRKLAVFPLPSIHDIQSEVTQFSEAVRTGAPATELGRRVYRNLFGAVPQEFLRRKHWLLEPDATLHTLPFAALVVGESGRGPVFLMERAALQSLPNALLLRRGAIPANGDFLGIGDPIYNAADPRFRGRRAASARGSGGELTLPRLPNTAGELQACARAWNGSRTRLLTGADSQMSAVQEAIRTGPAIIHFSTHVVSEPGEFRSGLIALGLRPAGVMELLGPKEIVARPVAASLVVMDGCYSGQGEALPSAGLMGLTRAWIGAGASAVIATRWDVPDDSAQSLMTRFYTALRTSPERGAAFALQEAQIAALHGGDGVQAPSRWAGYFLLSRIE
jgi:CHAT domain-containing protein/tetratricopeptide (TPR) repeat protein